MDYRVPESILIPESKRVVTEVLDGILAKAFGFHFLEPVAVETKIRKVVPDIKSRRTLIPNTGRPVEQSHEVRMDQEISKD